MRPELRRNARRAALDGNRAVETAGSSIDIYAALQQPRRGPAGAEPLAGWEDPEVPKDQS